MLSRLQRLLLEALLSDDPAATLRRLVERADDLSDEERACLERIDADGFTLAGLLVQKLRFERLTAADPEMAELFARQPGQFVQLFRAYTSADPPTSYFPGQEAGCYHQWQQRGGPFPLLDPDAIDRT